MSDFEPLPRYRVDGDIDWYTHFLPMFEHKSLTVLINEMVNHHDKVRILDLGAGDFTFAIDCHKRWPGKVEVTGVSRDNFLSPERAQLTAELGIPAQFIEMVNVPKVLPPNFQIAVSVLTNIYDSRVDYVDLMWRMLSNEGIGLLDNLPISPKEDVTNLEQRLHEDRYQVEILNPYRSIPDRLAHSHVSFEPAPASQRQKYLNELGRLKKEETIAPSKKPVPDVTIAFRKDDHLGNLGQKIQGLIKNNSHA